MSVPSAAGSPNKKRSPNKKGFSTKGSSVASLQTSDADETGVLPQETSKQVADRVRLSGCVTLELRIMKDEVEEEDLFDDDEDEDERDGAHALDEDGGGGGGAAQQQQETEEEEDKNFGFGYKAVHRKDVPVPRTYLEMQTQFATAFPWHDETLVVERLNGKMVTPVDCKFEKGDVIVFREYVPTTRREKLKGKVRGLGKGWEEEEYAIQTKSFKLRTWQL